VFLLCVGLMGLRNYFRLHGPPLSELHEVTLAGVTNVVAEPEISGSARIGRIWLETSAGERIPYHQSFPCSDEIRRLDTNYGLLLDKSNTVWGVTTSRGETLGRRYFEERNIEAKTVGKACGSLLTFIGVWGLLASVMGEIAYRAGKLQPKNVMPIRTRQLVLYGSIIGYAVLLFVVVRPFLPGGMGFWPFGLLWVLGVGLIGNGIVAYYRKHPPRA
jgi:hypothetical protein